MTAPSAATGMRYGIYILIAHAVVAGFFLGLAANSGTWSGVAFHGFLSMVWFVTLIRSLKAFRTA